MVLSSKFGEGAGTSAMFLASLNVMTADGRGGLSADAQADLARVAAFHEANPGTRSAAGFSDYAAKVSNVAAEAAGTKAAPAAKATKLGSGM